MREIYDAKIELKPNTNEEIMPFNNDFLYVASRGHFSDPNKCIPWHWHRAVELFYIESGAIEYHTSSGTILLSEGDGGFVNSGVLHMTKLKPQQSNRCTQLIHMFDTTFITGHTGSIIDQKYISPITEFSGLEIIPLFKNQLAHAAVLDKIKTSFLLSEEDLGYEIRLRSLLADILVDLWMISVPKAEEQEAQRPQLNEKMKMMVTYIHEHYGEKIVIQDIAEAAFVSVRECYRSFHTIMHMTPNEYIRQYRLQMACRLLTDGTDSITNIAQACGFGTSSFFGKVFREYYNMTPVEYRNENMKILS